MDAWCLSLCLLLLQITSHLKTLGYRSLHNLGNWRICYLRGVHPSAVLQVSDQDCSTNNQKPNFPNSTTAGSRMGEKRREGKREEAETFHSESSTKSTVGDFFFWQSAVKIDGDAKKPSARIQHIFTGNGRRLDGKTDRRFLMAFRVITMFLMIINEDAENQ